MKTVRNVISFSIALILIFAVMGVTAGTTVVPAINDETRFITNGGTVT